MQSALLARATAMRDANTHTASSPDEIHTLLAKDGPAPFILCALDMRAELSAQFQDFLATTKLSVRCLPENGLEEVLATGTRCVLTGGEATHIALLAKSY
jgi:hypothetical protein